MSLKRHLGGYALVGVLQWALEYGVWFVLSTWLLPVAPANVIGRIVGAVVGFWLNGRHTFKSEHTEISHRQLVRFIAMWLALTALNTLLVHVADARVGLGTTRAIKPLIDVLTGAVGFVLSRYWVYHKAGMRERLAKR